QRMTFQIRFSGNPAALIPAVRQLVKQVDPNLPVHDIRTLEEQIERTQLTQEMLFASFATAFGVVALFLVCVGLYGVMSYNVVRRIHEIGIRIALGARTRDVRLMVMRETLLLIISGVGLGLAVALALTHRIQAMLFGLAPDDPITFAMVVGLLG